MRWHDTVYNDAMQPSLEMRRHSTRTLIPALITHHLANGQLTGTFSAAGLYLDLSGFTSLTESLIEYGTDGVETLTMTVEALFAPLIESTFDHGGFIAGFAGDAFSALFPQRPDEDSSAAAFRALAAAEAMQASMNEQGEQHLAQGDYSLKAKIGLGLGEVEWAISTSDDDTRAVYLFKGPAISESALAENESRPGDIVASRSFFQAISPDVAVLPQQGHDLITQTLTSLGADGIYPDLPESEPDQLGRFVPESVVRQSAKGEFRQILSLFINLRGEPGTDELEQVLGVVFRLLHHYGGVVYRINFDDKGCNLYVFWGAPTSQENDLRRALAFVLELRDDCAVPLRAGLTSRMAYAGFMGSPVYEEYTCYSRGVNLAARMMTSAPWGDIWLDDRVAQRAERTHQVEPIGPRAFKGFVEPEYVHRLIAAREVSGYPVFRGEFIGRESELRQLTERLAPLANQESPGVYLIAGDAGIGKSRLVHEFLEQVTVDAGYQVIMCQSDELLQQPLNPFHYGLRRYFQQSPGADEARRLVTFNGILDALIDTTTDDDLRDELRRTRSFIGHVVDLHWPDSLYERVDPQLRAENTQNALKALFKAISRQQPLIIHMEDAHALDRDSLALLPYLMRNIEAYPIALLLTARHPLPDDLFDEETPQVVRHLLPLNLAATGRLVSALAAEPPTDELVDLLASHSEGNPLFVEQMLMFLTRQQSADSTKRAGTPPTQMGGLDMPTDVRSLLIARLDQLPPQVRESTQIASVLGREFDQGTLAAMLQEPAEFDVILEQGALNDIWYPIDEERYLFRHALLKDVAYDMQLRSRRRQLHGQAAELLTRAVDTDAPPASQLAEIAYHYDRGDRARQAAVYYGRAATQSAAAYNNLQAVDYFSRALQLTAPTDLEARYDLLLGREAVYALLGRRDDQLADLRALKSALVVSPDNHHRAELLLRQAAYALVRDNYDEATAYAEQSAEAAAAVSDPVAEGRALHRLGRALWQQGQAAEAEPYLQQALALVREGSAQVEMAECLHDLGVVWQYLGNQPVALEYAIQAQAIYSRESHAQGLVRTANLVGIINYSLGHYAASSAAYAEGLELVREIGWRYAESTILINKSHYALDFGEYEMARQNYEEGLTIARETADREGQITSLDALGLVAYCEDQTAVALDNLNQSLALARQIANDKSIAYPLTHIGLVMAENGQAVDAIQLLQEALDLRRRLGNEAAVIDTLAALAAAQLHAGQPQEATASIQIVLDWIKANGVESLELPIKTYLIAYEVLRQAEDGIAANVDSPARRCLQQAYELLQSRAESVADEHLRQRYLTQVPFNRELVSLWQRAAAD